MGRRTSRCEIIDVDGKSVRVQVTSPLTDEERAEIAEFMRWLPDRARDLPPHSQRQAPTYRSDWLRE